MPGGTANRFDVFWERRVGRPVGAVNPATPGRWLLAAGAGLAWLAEDGDLTEIGGEAAALAATADGGLRMNDAVCDPRGRLWAGSMPYDTSRLGAGSLFRVGGDWSVATVIPAVTVSNGLAWNAARDVMYYADSANTFVWKFRYDDDTGSISDGVRFVDLADAVPDGICIDDEDHLWVAAHGAGEVRRFSPTGVLTDRALVPGVGAVTACALGGVDRRTLFVTTAHIGMTEAQRREHPNAGRVHAVDVAVSGPPASPFMAGAS